MKRLISELNCYFLVVLAFLLMVSCDHKKTVPFPENPSGFKVPVAVPFKFPEANPFQWKEIPADSIPKGVTSYFDINKLPSKPFSIHDFKPLKSPLSSTPLNWNKIEKLKINLDTIKAKPVRLTKFRLPEPLITRLNPPTKWEGTTSGLLRLAQSEGLIGNQIYALVADSLGSIWISTERGLCKYNGDVFQSYNFLKKDLTGNLELIADFDLDKSGNIWMVANISGIYKLNTSSGIVEHYKTGAGFIRIQEDYNGLIWVTKPDKGFYFMDPRNRSIKQLKLPVSKTENNETYGVFEDASKNLWIGYRNKLAILNAERNSIRLIGKAEGLTIGIPYNFTQDSKGNVWIAAFSKEAKSISLAEDKIFTLGTNEGFYGVCRDVVSDAYQRIWIVDNDTVSIYDPVSHRLKKIPTGAAFRVDGLPSRAISDLKGNVWIGTAKSGILIMESQGMLSEHFNTSNGLVSNEVWGILEDKYQRIWLATYRGINIYDPAKGKLYLLKLPDKISTNNFRKLSFLDEDHLLVGSVEGFCIIDIKTHTLTTYQSNKSLAGNFWQGFYDREGNLWLSSSKGVYKFNPDKNRMWNIDESSGLISNTVWFLVPDQKGKIWIGTGSGVNVIDPKENTILTIRKEDGLTSNYSSMVFKNKMEEMIIGGDKGFSIINQQRNLITNVSAKEGLIPEGLYDMTELNGRIHIGSENGLIIVDRPTDAESGKAWRFTNYNKSEGFTSNDYNQGAAFPTSGGKVWWAASPVLSVILQDPIIDSVVPKSYITGINIMDQHPEFLDLKRINSQLAAGDTIWNSERTRYYIKDKFPVDSSYLAQNKIIWDSLSSAYHMPIGLKLPYNQNSFNFSFTNLDIKGRDKIVYRYILDGADETWSETSSKSESKNYYNIEPGKYIFKVATRGFNGVWSHPAELSFTIAPPWWKTWWAYLIEILCFSLIVWFTAQVRSQWLKKENRVLEEKVTHRTSQLNKTIEELKSTQSQLIQSEKMASLGELTAGIAHEIQNPLNFVNNFSEVSNELIDEMNDELAKGDIEEAKAIAADIKQNLEKINHHGKRADAIVKGMLQHSRSSSGTKEPTNINALADEYLRLAYHGLRAKDKSFNASMKTNFDESIGNINVIPQDIGRVILNLITNAFYAVTEKKRQAPPTPEGGLYEPTVSVSTSFIPPSGGQSGAVLIAVSDNGFGIPQKVIDKIFQPFFTTKPTGEGTGLGLSMSYEIVTKGHGGELKVETKEGEGSVFTIVLPV
jgi:signal transduction histidine kinase/ligand-binding sensor domain-containing protein